MNIQYLKNTSFLFIVLLALSACQEPLNSEYDQPLESLLLVEGKITTDTTSHYVYLTRTAALSDKDILPETGAQISITNNSSIIPLSELEAGSGKYYTAPNIYGKVGETYTLDIELSNGEKYTSTTQIQRNTEIDSMKILFEEFQDYGFFSHNLYFHGLELAEEGNAYLWNVYLNDTLYNDTLWKTTFVDDEFVNGNYIGVGQETIESVITGKDSIHILVSNFPIYSFDPEEIILDTINVLVEMESIPHNYYKFYQTLLDQTVRVGSPFDANKADLLTNISGNALGFFYGASIRRYNFKYLPPEESKGFVNPKAAH